jgi:hypothetical protein
LRSRQPWSRIGAILGAVVLAALTRVAAEPSQSGAAASPASAGISASRTELRRTFLTMFARAYYPGRTGQLMVVPRERVVITRRDPTVPFMHGSPWPYDTRIPLLLHGRRFVRPGRYRMPVRQQDIAPTVARVLGVPPAATTTGRALDVALSTPAGRPRGVLILVLDGMRPDYFDRYAARLTALFRLRREGAWFDGARVDYLPSNTGVGHTTIATGTDPRIHGITGNNLFERSKGRYDTYAEHSPKDLAALTIADLWMAVTNGRAIVIAQGSTMQSSTPLAGHGACALNGWPVFLAGYNRQNGTWQTNEDCFRLSPALKALNAKALLDSVGGTWHGRTIRDFDILRRTAVFSRFEGEALLRAIDEQPLGEDDVPDLVLANLKAADHVSHQHGPDSVALQEALEEQDTVIGRVREALDAKWGADGYFTVVTADHGMPPEPPDASGRIYSDDVLAALNERFDPGRKTLVAYYEPENAQIFVDMARLRELGLSLAALRSHLEALPFVFAAYTEDDVRQAAGQLH